MRKYVQHIILLLTVFLFMISGSVMGQFYNGHQMTFGKNRVQFNELYWQFFRYPRFDTYFYVGGEQIAQNVSDIVTRKLPELENFFDYNCEKRLIFIVYNRLSDFRQSNIGLVSGDDQYNIGGVTKIIDNKVFIYYEGDNKKLEEQVTAAITEIILSEMLYGKNFRQKLTNSTLMSIPDWYIQGLISYLSRGWDFKVENKVKDGIISGKYEKFNHLTGEDAVYAGHSIWNYIAANYGIAVIPNIIYLTRISKNADSGFLYVLGTPLKYFTTDWLSYYHQIYNEGTDEFTEPEGTPVLKRTKKNNEYYQFKISKDGTKAAWATNELGKYKIWIQDLETSKRKKIYKREHKLEQIPDYSYPVIAWHPSGSVLSFITEEKGEIKLNFYFMDENKIKSKELFQFDKITGFSYSDNGLKMVMSAVMDGKPDIYVYNVSANTVERITNDDADDQFPRFIEGSSKILFSSNRKNDKQEGDEVEIQPVFDNYVYDYKNSKSLKKVTDTRLINETHSFPLDKDKYVFLSDKSGIINRYVGKYDSVISFIDTTTHYRYIATSYPVTNYPRNIISHDYCAETGTSADLYYSNNSFRLLLSKPDLDNEVGVKETPFRKKYSDILIMKDSVKVPVKKTVPNKPENELMQEYVPFPDSSKIDLNHYVFEIEVKTKSKSELKETSLSDSSPEKEKQHQLPKQRVYFTTFFPDYVVNQIDFGFLNSSYQAYTGSEVYFNPGFNMFFKLGAKDLFEDYRITGGIRFAANFDSNEYLLSFENVKKRLDKQILFHRQSFSSVSSDYYNVLKTHTHELMYILKYPFSQVAAVKATTVLRNDRIVNQSIDYESLKDPNKFNNWGGLKLEFIFDNTINKGLNLYNGTRMKVFAEAYKQIDRASSELFVFGGDLRHYQKIHRDLILASRIAGSTSLGQSRLIYYLGSVDNWIKLTEKVPKFIPLDEVPIYDGSNYAYQSLATNLRGFPQNIRNGNSFLVINNELRWPIVKYIANRPVNSEFLTNLQLIGFFDIGSAWSGKSPYDEKNEYNYYRKKNGPITVIIDLDRSPYVMGYGFGLRTKLLGYFVRADWAWGVDSGIIQPRIFYLSLSLDF